MRRPNRQMVLAMVLAMAGIADATVWYVPSPGHRTIQQAIDDQAVLDGDTIVVWGEGTPPFTYDAINYNGKGLFIVNRSYYEDMGPNYPPNPFWTQIKGNGSSVVTITNLHSRTTATLKGFTVVNGNSTDGGGIYCFANTVCGIVIQSDSIVENHASLFGGGVYFEGQGDGVFFLMRNCVVMNNHAVGYGGGVFSAQDAAVAETLECNRVASNDARYMGGGVCLFGWPAPHVRGSLLAGNTISDNHLSDNSNPEGAGLYAAGWPNKARHNVITHNIPNGVHTMWNDDISSLIDLGTAEDPGYNVLAWNQDPSGNELDLTIDGDDHDEQFAVGNYWGTLGSSQIRSHIEFEGQMVQERFHLDPIAASGRYFDVVENSYCTTGVIVTGDVSVQFPATLTLGHGITVQCLTTTDYSAPGGDPGKNDLIVRSGAELSAYGWPGQRITFTSYRQNEPPMPGAWYGIRIQNDASGYFNECNVNSGSSASRLATTQICLSNTLRLIRIRWPAS